MKYEIHTPSYYGIIHDNGNIQREDVEHSPSHQWKAVAVVHYNNFWHEYVILYDYAGTRRASRVVAYSKQALVDQCYLLALLSCHIVAIVRDERRIEK